MGGEESSVFYSVHALTGVQKENAIWHPGKEDTRTMLNFKHVTLGCLSAGVDEFQNNSNREI